MPRRPTNVPTFATDPAGGAVVEPVSDVREAGFAPSDQPPAEWFNWLFNHYGQWIDFLRSFDPANSARWAVTPVFTRLAVDDQTVEAGIPLHRMIGIGNYLSTHIWSSVSGETWLERTLNSATAFGTPICGTFGINRWFIGSGTNIAGPFSGTGKIWTTFPEGSGYGVSSVGDDSNNWTACTVPGGTTDVRAIACGTHPTYGEHIVAVTNTAILDCSAFGGGAGTLSAFAASSLSAVVTAAALFCDVVYSGSSSHTGQWIAVTTKGDVYTASDPSGTWTKNATNLGVHPWRLAVDGAGVVCAYFTNSSTGSAFFLSVDDGATWPAGTAPPFSGLTQIRYIDGAWFCTLAGFAPFLATSPDLSSGSWLRLPTPYDELGTMDLGDMVYSAGALVIAGNGAVLVSKRASNLSPAPYAPGNTPAPLNDAAYLRGRLIDSTAPTLGQMLSWDVDLEEWTPGGPHATPVMTTTARDAYAAPFNGMLILNSTTGKLNFYFSGAWHAVTST